MDNHDQGSTCDQRHMTGNASTEHELKFRRGKPKHKQALEALQVGQSQETLTRNKKSKHLK